MVVHSICPQNERSAKYANEHIKLNEDDTHTSAYQIIECFLENGKSYIFEQTRPPPIFQMRYAFSMAQFWSPYFIYIYIQSKYKFFRRTFRKYIFCGFGGSIIHRRPLLLQHRRFGNFSDICRCAVLLPSCHSLKKTEST